MKALLNSRDVCQLLLISPATLSRMVRSNRIPYVLLGKGKVKLAVRFREDELERWIARRSRGAVPRNLPVQNCDDVATENKKSTQVSDLATMPLVSQTS